MKNVNMIGESGSHFQIMHCTNNGSSFVNQGLDVFHELELVVYVQISSRLVQDQ